MIVPAVNARASEAASVSLHVLAGDRFDRPDLREEGVGLAVVIDQLTVETSLGRILLPGLWAKDREPYAYTPSCTSRAAFALLARATQDERWDDLQAGGAAATRALHCSAALPPSWTEIHSDGLVEATSGALGQGDPVQPMIDRVLVATGDADMLVVVDVSRRRHGSARRPALGAAPRGERAAACGEERAGRRLRPRLRLGRGT